MSLTLQNVRQAMIDTVHDYRKHHPVLSPNEDERDSTLLDYLTSGQPISSWSQVNALSGLYSNNFQAGLDPVRGTTEPFRQVATCTPFAQGVGWYYLSAYQVNPNAYRSQAYASMTLMLFRKPLMTKRVAAARGLTMDQASLWAVTGGYTRLDGQWQVLGDGTAGLTPTKFTTDPNGSTSTQGVTLDPRPGTTKGIYTCGLSNSSSPTYLSISIPPVGVVDKAGNTVSFGRRQPSLWSLDLTASKGFSTVSVVIQEHWTDETGKEVKTAKAVDITLVTSSPGVWNSKNGCSCACGLGSWYGSQPYLTLKEGSIGGTPLTSIPANPSGWLDRQRVTTWASSSSFLCQLLLTWKRWLGAIKPASWFWGTVQPYPSLTKESEDPVVYMYFHTTLDTSLMVAGHRFETGQGLSLHRYNPVTGEADLDVRGAVTLEATYSSAFSPAAPFPCAYTLEVDEKVFYLRLPIERSQARSPYPKPWPPVQISSLGAMVLPPLVPTITGTNIECHGYLYNQDSSFAGACFFEAMAFDPEPVRLARTFDASGMLALKSGDELFEIYRTKNLSFKQAAPTFFTTLAFILLFLGIFLTLTVVPIVLVKRHHKKMTTKTEVTSQTKSRDEHGPYNPDASSP